MWLSAFSAVTAAGSVLREALCNILSNQICRTEHRLVVPVCQLKPLHLLHAIQQSCFLRYFSFFIVYMMVSACIYPDDMMPTIFFTKPFSSLPYTHHVSTRHPPYLYQTPTIPLSDAHHISLSDAHHISI